MTKTSLYDRLFKASDGTVVVRQKPNWQVYVVIAGVLLARLVDDKDLSSVFLALSTATALYWSWLEISEGANLFRNILGWIIGIGSLIILIQDIV